jgi:hypothetical protein
VANLHDVEPLVGVTETQSGQFQKRSGSASCLLFLLNW